MTTRRIETVRLQPVVEGDGRLGLSWQAPGARSCRVLLVRTGTVPAYHALHLDGATAACRFDRLSRHQRYLVSVLADTGDSIAASDWWSVTPASGLEPRLERAAAPLPAHLSAHQARLERVAVMPQSGRVTAWWTLGRGFVDCLVLELLTVAGEELARWELEPEVGSIALDARRGVRLADGAPFALRLGVRFASLVAEGARQVAFTPAPQGREREANRAHPQDHLVYPTLSLGEEVRIFDEEAPAEAAAALPRVVCGRCQSPIPWRDYLLRCPACGAEYIPNGRGDYLELTRLRFGVCRCCLPKKILIQRAGSDDLVCAGSGKAHIRLPDTGDLALIEDLPYGLCQCCRPRRPLVGRAGAVRCSQSGESHRAEAGRYVLVPSQPVYDAAAIDELLDAGLAEICSTGVSRAGAAARNPRRRR